MTVRVTMTMGLAAGVLALGASAALAQSQVINSNEYVGAHFSVAAPQGASWALNCGFPPVTYAGIGTVNRFNLEGAGAERGRLPTDRAWCSLTKTGGEGPVGFAVVKNGQATSAGTSETGQPARLEVF